MQISFQEHSVEVEIRNPNDHIQKKWVNGNFYEAHRNGLLSYMAQSGKYFGKKLAIDIGASVGNHSLFFSKVLGAELVIAIEPHLPSFEHLTVNIGLNPTLNIDKVNCALGDHDGTCSMKPINPQNSGMAQVVEGNSVTMRKLDSFEGISDFDYMKIDVEHYNEQLLEGARKTLKTATGDVFIEAETDEVLAVTDKIMSECGYKRIPNLCLNHTPTYLYVKA